MLELLPPPGVIVPGFLTYLRCMLINMSGFPRFSFVAGPENLQEQEDAFSPRGVSLPQQKLAPLPSCPFGLCPRACVSFFYSQLIFILARGQYLTVVFPLFHNEELFGHLLVYLFTLRLLW